MSLHQLRLLKNLYGIGKQHGKAESHQLLPAWISQYLGSDQQQGFIGIWRKAKINDQQILFQLIFKFADLLANAGLGHVQALGSACEMLDIGSARVF